MTTEQLTATTLANPDLAAHVQHSHTLRSAVPERAKSLLLDWDAATEHQERSQLAQQLTNLFALEAALEGMLHQAVHQQAQRLQQALVHARMPDHEPELQALHQAHRRLFGTNGRDLATAWFRAAVREGSDAVLLSRVRSDWTDARERINQELGPRTTQFLGDADVTYNNALPERADVQVDKRRGKGWQDVDYDPEAGYRTFRDDIKAARAGRNVTRAGHYPTMAELQPPEDAATHQEATSP